ncbi:MAG TPA: SOS response-associated peptidase [Chloroflexota bacterium]
MLAYNLALVCGRFNLTRPSDIEERFGFMDWHERRIAPRFNIAPTQEILTIVQRADGGRAVQVATWGLVPLWMRDRPKPHINARLETAAASPMFRAAQRCLIPATGFYEWRSKMPMHIGLQDGGLFVFAGLWLPGRHDGLPTATILTGPPNDLVAGIHNRMPAILRPDQEAAWLDASVADPFALLRPLPSELMRAYAVVPLVNSVANDGPGLLEPAKVEQKELFARPAVPPGAARG